MNANMRAYRGLGMDGPIAAWYARNTGRDLTRFTETARLVAKEVRPGSEVLEIAPGPGFLSVELAKLGYKVTAIDISPSFVTIVRENADKAGVVIDVRQGNASQLSLPDSRFDAIVCTAAFKNFGDPVGALDEMYRVLRPRGTAIISDLRKDVRHVDIDSYVQRMRLTRWNAALTRWVFRYFLLRRAYTRAQLGEFIRKSRFGIGRFVESGIGYELFLRKQ